MAAARTRWLLAIVLLFGVHVTVTSSVVGGSARNASRARRERVDFIAATSSMAVYVGMVTTWPGGDVVDQCGMAGVH